MKWVVDPGLDGDVYADRPYLYGPAASSVNKLHVGGKAGDGRVKAGDENGKEGIGHHEAGLVFEEGGSEEGLEIRNEKGVPETEAARKKHFLVEEKRKEWEWEEGRVYGVDFYNPYLDFNGGLRAFLFYALLVIIAAAYFISWSGEGGVVLDSKRK